MARRETGWLRLVEPEGQWLAPAALHRAFPSGFEAIPETTRDALRDRYPRAAQPSQAEWDAWIDWLLRDCLAWGNRYVEGDAAGRYAYNAAEHNVTLRADAALDDPEGGKPRVLMARYAHGTPLDKRLSGDRWNASPIDRTLQLCRTNDVRIGLVTDGEKIVLLWATVGGVGGSGTWDTSLFSESKERDYLRAFVSLLGAKRFFAVEEAAQLEAIFEASEKAQGEVTKDLGTQVRQAVELLVSAISRANLERGGDLLRGIPPHAVYEAAATVLMRLVFLLYAEERDLFPLNDPIYADNYAVSTLRDDLDEQAMIEGDAPLELRNAAWFRLLAMFRMIYHGVSHDRLRMPAYGGRLFDPSRFSFLEAMPVDDLTVRAVLEAIQTLPVIEDGETKRIRLSYRALDVEQIGHVYERLLDHNAVRVDGVEVRLVGKGDETEKPLADLEQAAGSGDQKLVSFLMDITGKSDGVIQRMIEKGRRLKDGADSDMRRRVNTACESDNALADRISPFAYALDNDLHDLPAVFPQGSLVVKKTRTRRESGTEYTPRELAEEMVHYALEPLVYSPGPTDGVEPKGWRLRSSSELLKLKICDPAVGSGAFLVAACRYLGDRVAEVWLAEDPSREKADRDDLTLDARRAVVDRCLYGVDKDAMAVEMAKLSLWLITLGRERPFSFLDHAIKHGDSLLGIGSLDQLRYVHMSPEDGRVLYDGALFGATERVTRLVEAGIELRERLESVSTVTIRDAELKQRLNDQANEVLEVVNVIGDAITSVALSTAGQNEKKLKAAYIELSHRVRDGLNVDATELERRSALEQLRSESQRLLNAERPPHLPPRATFHWPVVFPEVFAHGGFDAMVGNPPFMGGKKISGSLGSDYLAFLFKQTVSGRGGLADLVSYFFLRASTLSESFAFLAVNTITQGDTREVGLDALSSGPWKILRAVGSRRWPGSASVHVSQLWLSRMTHSQQPCLDGQVVSGITTLLTQPGRVLGNPYRLRSNAGKAFIGSYVLGMGFTLPPEDAATLIDTSERNRDVLFPYLNAEDLLRRPDQSASRWIINFFDWTLERSAQYAACLEIVRNNVKPQRDLNKKSNYRNTWWQFAERCPGLYEAISSLSRVIVVPQVSKAILPAFYPTGVVFSHSLAVIANDSEDVCGILTSNIHRSWARRYGSTHLKLTNYSVTDCFETFPFPTQSPGIGETMARLDEQRRAITSHREIGLTRVYNRINDPRDGAPEINKLRSLHEELDRAVCDAYGWSSLDLGYGFHETDEGVRWTPANPVREEILDRLLELNQQRHAEEAAQGLANTDGPKTNRSKSASVSATQIELVMGS